jgi:mannose-6-phosphate isomerase class I
MPPELLRPDNFTPPSRTPWGGTRILERFKAGLGIEAAHPVIGESWEISVEPSFQSRLVRSDEALSAKIAQEPEAWLGRAVAERHGGQTPLLVKLLDAADDLSVQVHPRDGDPALGEAESGKPESWIVLEASPGAGLYLGWRDGVDRTRVERCLSEHGALSELLNFVPVAAGDSFVVRAGVPHAIGRGVTLVEPQFVAPGRCGVTYRFWDWNRRYDAAGRIDPGGQPRALHVERSLAVTAWGDLRGEAFLASCRPREQVLEDGAMRRVETVVWEWFVVEQWMGTGVLRISAVGTMLGLTCVGGSGTVATRDATIRLGCGQSCVVPASCGDLEIVGRELHVVATRSP